MEKLLCSEGDSLPFQPTNPIMSDLCERCKTIDIPSILSTIPPRSTKNETLMVLDLGPFPAKFETQTCSLCKFFYDMRWPTHITAAGRKAISARRPSKLAINGATDLQGRSYKLYAFDFYMDERKTKGGWDEYMRSLQNGEFQSSHVFAVVDTKWTELIDWVNDDPLGGEIFQTAGFIFPIIADQNPANPIISVCPVPDYLNQSSYLKDCLEFCEKNHSVCRTPSPGQQPQAACRFIDCKTGKIFPPSGTLAASESYEYVALSYVWGGKTGFDLPGKFLKVVEAAMKVVLALGKRYLWVDQYCIHEYDEKEKEQQIRGMAFIYENAVVTIVDAVGHDSTYGIQGVTSPRPPPPQWSSGNINLCSTLPDVRETIRQSKWFTRGWTFQEAICSTRLIIFTENQVYFECREIARSERLDSPLRLGNPSRHYELLNNSPFDPTSRLFNQISPRQPKPKFDDVWECVAAYTARKLSHDNDSLNAFRGILERYRAGPLNCLQFNGIPLQHSDTRGYWPGEFVRQLCWGHITPPLKRRSSFPSWTWAGWEGTLINGMDRLYFATFSTNIELELHVELKNGGKMPWQEFWTSILGAQDDKDDEDQEDDGDQEDDEDNDDNEGDDEGYEEDEDTGDVKDSLDAESMRDDQDDEVDQKDKKIQDIPDVQVVLDLPHANDVEKAVRCLHLSIPVVRLDTKVYHKVEKDTGLTKTHIYLQNETFQYEINLPIDRMEDSNFVASFDDKAWDCAILRGGNESALDSRPFLMLLQWFPDHSGAERLWGDWLRAPGIEARFFAMKLRDRGEMQNIRLF